AQTARGFARHWGIAWSATKPSAGRAATTDRRSRASGSTRSAGSSIPWRATSISRNGKSCSWKSCRPRRRSSSMRALRERRNRLWFAPAPPGNLGFCRALFFGLTLLLYLNHDFSAWADVSSAFWMPTWFFRNLHVPVLSREQLVLLQIVWKAALGLSCLG